MAGNRAIDVLELLRKQKGTPGLKIVKVNTTSPLTLIFEGTKQAIDIDIFEVPISLYPLKKNDRLMAYPLVGNGAAQRWGLLVNLNGGLTIATMQSANSLTIPGVDGTVAADSLIIPPSVATDSGIRALQAGDQVSIAPTYSNGKLKYIILQKY